ncbi:MAG: hypothetical protein ACREN7_06975 [Candidatus Dormibacteria bacterium]
MSNAALADQSDAQLEQAFERNSRAVWRAIAATLIGFFSLVGVTFGVRALAGAYPASGVLALAMLTFFTGMAVVCSIAIRQTRVRFEVARRARQRPEPPRVD